MRRITTDPTDEVVPHYSLDGHWIYFGSNRSGSWQIWKVPSDGGSAVQITREGGMSAVESADGQFLYYCGYFAQKKGIWRVPVSGGPETLTLNRDIFQFHWDLRDGGIYFIDSSANRLPTISFFDFATRGVRGLSPVSNDPGYSLTNGLSVSPDGKWLLYTGGIFTSGIMMIDNFR